MSTQEYMQKVVEDVGDIENFLKKGKLKQVVAIIKSCSPNALEDLNVTLKHLSCTIPGTINYNILDVGSYGKDITVGSAMILANVLVFTPKPSKHYINITKRNVVEVFYFEEENLDESEDYSDNNLVGKKNWVESEEGEIILESVQNDVFIDNIAESEPINGDSRENLSDSMVGPVKQRNGFSILECFQEFIDIGQAMGYKMKRGEKKKQWVKKLCHSNQVNFLSIQETKLVSLDVFVVKILWGNMLFDFATSSARGRSGGILCVWDKLLFHKKRTYATEHCLCVEGLILHHHLSDHRPILLKETHVDYGPTPFRLYHSWFLEDDFHSVIEDSWNNDGISASNSVILLKNKLKFMKQILKEWSSIKRRHKDHDRKVIQDSLIEIDLRLDKGTGLPDDLTRRANLFRDLKDIDHKDSIDLAQKEKI
nr:hypothetical protein [Tanacetum cinerariifolium]